MSEKRYSELIIGIGCLYIYIPANEKNDRDLTIDDIEVSTGEFTEEIGDEPPRDSED